MNRDYWQSVLEREEQARGYHEGFKLLFCPWHLIETADTVFLSLNPGSDPSGEYMRIASDERGNSYLVRREAKHSPIAEQYRRLCDFIERDPETVLAGALMPFRTSNWLRSRDRTNISVSRPFWQKAFTCGRVHQVFCMGREVENEVVALTGAAIEREVPANWGKLSIRRYRAENGLLVYGLLHFSTYKMFSRPECVSALQGLLDSSR
ncbi:MAG: hypothetical protein AAGJ91_07680 [Pseudomonadota bacterium]